MKRPASVSVVAWILLVLAGLGVIGTVNMLNDPNVIKIMESGPLPITVQVLLIFTGLIVSLTSSIAMLQGQNWGRMLYVFWNIFTNLVSLITNPQFIATMIPSLVMFGIVAFFLFRPKANQYFTGRVAA